MLPVSLPIDATLDRFALGVLGAIWILAYAAPRPLRPRWPGTPLAVIVLAFLVVAGLSVVLDLTTLSRLNELELAIKKLSLVLSYVAFGVITATSIRQTEIRPFLLLTLGLAAVMAIGTIIEYRSGINYFYNLSRDLLVGVTVGQEPVDSEFVRPSITGPTGHGLAVAGVLAMALPFALLGIIESNRRFQRILYGLLVVLVFAGGVATLRKTALVAPAAALVILVAYRPRAMVRLLPLGVVVILGIHLMAPGAMGAFRFQLNGGAEESNLGRTSDYAAIIPDVLAHPIVGRGYGTYDPVYYKFGNDPQRHRFLDNQYLLLLVETGIFGLVLYLAIPLSSIATLHRTARSSDRTRAGPAAAIIAAMAAFVVGNALFDTLAFPQMPYVAFFLLGIGTVLRGTVSSRSAQRGSTETAAVVSQGESAPSAGSAPFGA
jgi:O-antigen ligase